MGLTPHDVLAYPPPPNAPPELTVPAANATLVLVALCAVAAVGIVWSLGHWYRRGNIAFLAVLLGGLVTSLLEPFADVLGLVWFPEHDQVHAFTGLGVPIPLFVVVGYLCLFGLMTWMTLRHLESSPTRTRFWVFSSAMLLTACVFEWLLLTSGTYLYYGRQPLEVLGYPLYWMTINSGACMVAALVIYRFRGFFTGLRAFATLALIPCADGAVMLATGWPAFAGLHSDLPDWAVHLTGLVSIALGLAMRAAVAEVCCRGGRWYSPPRDRVAAATSRGSSPTEASVLEAAS
jgi:hypothetical protein